MIFSSFNRLISGLILLNSARQFRCSVTYLCFVRWLICWQSYWHDHTWVVICSLILPNAYFTSVYPTAMGLQSICNWSITGAQEFCLANDVSLYPTKTVFAQGFATSATNYKRSYSFNPQIRFNVHLAEWTGRLHRLNKALSWALTTFNSRIDNVLAGLEPM